MDSEVTVKHEADEIRKAGGAGRWLGIGSVLLLMLLSMIPQTAEAAGEELFSQQCASCHALSSQRVVGPGLAGVVDLRDGDWLIRKITEPDRLASEGDAVTAELVGEYGLAMPNLGVTVAQAESIIAYLGAAAGDGQALAAAAGAGVPSTDTVFTSTQVEEGRALFEGSMRFENRGVSCNACHNVDHPDVFGGGSLAVDLTDSHQRLGSASVGAMLQNPPFPAMRVAYENRPLTEEEIASLTAFLQEASSADAEPTNYGARFFGAGLLGVLILIGFFSILWGGRRRESVNQSIYDRQLKSR